MTAPLRLSFEVGCRPQAAFRLWTEATGTWWPAHHTVSDLGGTEPNGTKPNQLPSAVCRRRLKFSSHGQQRRRGSAITGRQGAYWR
jgi:hypothetical protein